MLIKYNNYCKNISDSKSLSQELLGTPILKAKARTDNHHMIYKINILKFPKHSLFVYFFRGMYHSHQCMKHNLSLVLSSEVMKKMPAWSNSFQDWHTLNWQIAHTNVFDTYFGSLTLTRVTKLSGHKAVLQIMSTSQSKFSFYMPIS